MAKKKTGKSIKSEKLPKLAFLGLWFVGILGSIFLIAYVSLQVWMSTWKTYKINGVTVHAPSSWDVRDATMDSNKGGLMAGYDNLVKIGDSETSTVPNFDNTSKYEGNLLIYVFRNSKTGEYSKGIETSGDRSLKIIVVKYLAQIVASKIVFPSK